MALITITNMIIMGKKMRRRHKNRDSDLFLLKLLQWQKWVAVPIFLFILYGCQTLPAGRQGLPPKNSAVSSSPSAEGQAGQLGYINEAELIYATDIEDRGWELEDYRIETGDVLNISVWQVEDLQRTVVVRPDGKISFPLIEDIQAKGVTIVELRRTLEEKLGKYIRVPQVSIIVEAFGGKRAVVIDESGGGGIIRFTEPIRVVEALAMAGGYKTSVNLHKLYIVRGSMEKGKPTKIIIVNAHKIFREGNMSENILVRSDDVIFLARGWLSTLTKFVGQLDTLRTEMNRVITQANYYRNIDNIVPWYPSRTDIDLTRDDRAFTKGDWHIGDEDAD